MMCAPLGRDVVEQHAIESRDDRELGQPAKLKAVDTLFVLVHPAGVIDHPKRTLRNALSRRFPQYATTRLPPDLTYSSNNMLCDALRLIDLTSNSGTTIKSG